VRAPFLSPARLAAVPEARPDPSGRQDHDPGRGHHRQPLGRLPTPQRVQERHNLRAVGQEEGDCKEHG
jgi:hypothetical protein